MSESPVCQPSSPWVSVGEDMGLNFLGARPPPSCQLFHPVTGPWAEGRRVGTVLQRLDPDPEAKGRSAPAPWRLVQGMLVDCLYGPFFCLPCDGRLGQCPLLLLMSVTSQLLLIA